MHPSEGLTGIRSPVTQESSLEMFDVERLLQKSIFPEVEHAKAEIHAGTEVGFVLADFLFAQRCAADC